MNLKLKICFILTCVCGIVNFVNAQNNPSTYVDKKGILRWADSREEINEFGVHYALPFSSAYKGFAELGISPDKGIEDDVYHIARLGLSAYRIHLWDSEISDTLGNLVCNNHLRLLDYTLMQMKKRGIKIVITPLTYYETTEKRYGFGQKYKKKHSFTPQAIEATERYLLQLMNHINPYTGIAYKNDPDIIAFELYNEPEHQGHTEKDVVPYINRLVAAVRKSGCKKPLFYCMSIAPHLRKGFLKANIQGGSSQWYPVSHNAGFEFKGNLIPFVDHWPKDSLTDDIKNKHKALLAYEIDAADNDYAYTYPLIARTLRSVGFQFAAMFTYDPLGIAYANYDFRTHFMNLAYTPQKAIGLKIAGEIFKRIPRNTHFDAFPLDTVFDVFRVSHTNNLAEMVSDTKFIYSNNTQSKPSNLDKLKEIAGYGSSPIVKYEGKGVYFLDKLEDGVWRLEVMPDAIWVDNPFANPQLDKEVSAIVWNTYPMAISLSDLGKDFLMKGINEGNESKQKATDGKISVSPGTYLLIKNGVIPKWKPNDKWKNITLNEFVAPSATLNSYLLHQPFAEISRGNDFCEIKTEVISSQMPDSVQLHITTLAPKKLSPINFEKKNRYEYVAKIPKNLLDNEDMLNYQIVVYADGKATAYPKNVLGNYVNFTNTDLYTLRVVEKEAPICLMDVSEDCVRMRRSHRHYRYIFHSSELPNKLGIELGTDNLIYTSCYVKEKLVGRREDLSLKHKLEIRGSSLNDKDVNVWVVLQQVDGAEFGALIQLSKMQMLYELPLTDLKPIKVIGPGEKGKVTIKNYDWHSDFNISEIETVKIAVLSSDNKGEGDVKAAIEYIQLR